MTQNEKELLLKDLCARLPYGVKILHQGWNYEWDQELSTLEKVIGIDERFIYTKVINDNGEEYTSSKHTIALLDDKPYLFPLSSMNEEQRVEYIKTFLVLNRFTFCPTHESYDYLNKKHFDYRGLIEKELAIDATGLDIY